MQMVNVRLERAGKRLVYGISLMSLYLHYFPADGEHSFGEGWREDFWRRTRTCRGYELESKATKKGTKKESFEDFSSKLSHIKEGGHLLSRIALQYHRRRRA